MALFILDKLKKEEIKMNRKFTVKSILKFAGWAALFASIVLMFIKFVFNEQITFPIIMTGFSSSLFCLYLGYIHDNYEE